MLLNLGIFFIVLSVVGANSNNSDWALAVAINDEIELLDENGTLIGKAKEAFTNLKALTFDNLRHQFVVSDMDRENDTIYSINLTKETEINPIINDLPDDIQGLAIDPIEDILYWTDSINRTINFLLLNKAESTRQVLFTFKDENPQDVAVDICRRYIYWTNANENKATIERSKIGSGKREVLVDQDLTSPTGVAIDYRNDRIYWGDMREGIYFRIESTNLEGKERQLVYEGTHSKPFGIAVDNDSIYWTDLIKNVLWRMDKGDKSQPETIRQFEEKPMGLVSKYLNIRNLPDCSKIEKTVESYKPVFNESFIRESDETTSSPTCLHGTHTSNGCKCRPGYTGPSCEVSLCHNYCIHGSCRLSPSGYPQCHCHPNFGGLRCTKTCDGFCMNNGRCTFENGESGRPSCSCPMGYFGDRCQNSRMSEKLCSIVCRRKEIFARFRSEEDIFCGCDSKTHAALISPIEAKPLIGEQKSKETIYFKDPVFMSIAGIAFLALLISMVLSIYVMYLKRRPSPKIKRRYIVNKNTHSLTERPQSTEQCEITIENCCNMNVCETPCFEPKRTYRNDDKNMLLPNIEKNEDLY